MRSPGRVPWLRVSDSPTRMPWRNRLISGSRTSGRSGHVGWDLGAHDLWSMIALFPGTVTATADCVTVTSGGITDG